MILKMINETEMTKDDRKKFIPFVNQRNHMGQIIKNKQRDKAFYKSIQVFENLKKTTKEYFFDKKYQKMKQKLTRCKLSIEPRQPNYDNKIKECFKSLQKSILSKCKTLNDTNLTDSTTFFVDLNERLNQNISTLKEQIENNRRTKLLKSSKITEKFKTFHGNEFNQSRINDARCPIMKRTYPTKENKKKDLSDSRKKALTSSDEQSNEIQNKVISSVNRQIFKDITKQGERMVDFTNCGLKYKYMVESQKKDPWKKWYVDYRVEIFPGEVVKLKKLQKSIYG